MMNRQQRRNDSGSADRRQRPGASAAEVAPSPPPPRPCTLYPLHPPGSRVLMRYPSDLSLSDRIAVAISSLVIVGSVAWVPLLCRWVYRKIQSEPDDTRRRRYKAAVVLATLVAIAGPHRSPAFGNWIGVRRWRLWEAWMRFIAMEVIVDQRKPAWRQHEPPKHHHAEGRGPPSPTPPRLSSMDATKDPLMYAFVPHGIFPFAFAFGVFPEAAQRVFGAFRPVVATATEFFPVVRDILNWCSRVDASRQSVDEALRSGDRLGIVPGGIAEIFEGYPKAGTSPDEECTIVRKGFLRMCVRHNIPVLPVYVFGATKMFHRLHLPALERLSRLLRTSLVLFFGVWGLPIPFRQRLSYVMGDPIFPPPNPSSSRIGRDDVDERHVDDMHARFCDELLRLFERHKEAYGWGHKSLKLLTG